MLLVDRECVRRLIEAPDPDAVLVFVRGECVVMPARDLDDLHRRLVIAKREDVADFLSPGPAGDEQLDLMAQRLDNLARDLSA